MCEVDQEYQPEQNEKHGTDQRKVLAPDLKECLRDEECDDDEDQPDQNLRSPITVL